MAADIKEAVERLVAIAAALPANGSVTLPEGPVGDYIRALIELGPPMVAHIAALEEGLKPFAGDRLPSARAKDGVVDYDRHGLRCLMSPLRRAQDRARALVEGGE